MNNFRIFDGIDSVAHSITGDNASRVVYFVVRLLVLILIVPVLLGKAIIFVIGKAFGAIKSLNGKLRAKYRYGWAVVPGVLALLVVAIVLTVGIGAKRQPITSDVDYKTYKAQTLKTIRGENLRGIDISHWQRHNYKALIDDENVDFVITRASYGKKIDKCCDPAFQYAKQKGKLLGVYFFTNKSMRKSYDAREYARWAADQVRGYIGLAIFALDVENEGSKSNYVETHWAAEWLDEFEKATGVKPFIYINSNAAKLNDWSEATEYPLWVAHYDVPIGKPLTYAWESWKIHQYTDNKVDKDVFSGSASDWWSFAKISST